MSAEIRVHHRGFDRNGPLVDRAGSLSSIDPEWATQAAEVAYQDFPQRVVFGIDGFSGRQDPDQFAIGRNYGREALTVSAVGSAAIVPTDLDAYLAKIRTRIIEGTSTVAEARGWAALGPISGDVFREVAEDRERRFLERARHVAALWSPIVSQLTSLIAAQDALNARTLAAILADEANPAERQRRRRALHRRRLRAHARSRRNNACPRRRPHGRPR